MRSIKVQILNNQVVLADQCHVAESFLRRLVGLLGRERLAPGEGMLLRECNSVHMWFMRFPIDVVFLRSEKRAGRANEEVWIVSSIRERLMPWRLMPVMDAQASHALELPAGTARAKGLTAGDQLCSS